MLKRQKKNRRNQILRGSSLVFLVAGKLNDRKNDNVTVRPVRQMSDSKVRVSLLLNE